jgi:hypothetical protein
MQVMLDDIYDEVPKCQVEKVQRKNKDDTIEVNYCLW